MLVDIGGQKHRRDLDGKWTILDIGGKADVHFNLNKNKPLPFKDDSVNAIYCSHVMEHVEPERITPVLKQFYRILKPGCKARIVVPDCAYAINLYINNPKALSDKRYCSKPGFIPPTPMGFLTAWFRTSDEGGHKIGYDDELMRAFFKTTKFTKIQKLEYNKCSKIFRGKDYERYSGGWSLYFEIEK